MTKDPERATKRRVAVVGSGIVGLCLGEALHERGVSLRCFDKGPVGGGQSGGVTRIFRHRHEDPQLVGLALRTRKCWADLERRMGVRLVGEEGVLILGDGKTDEASRLRQLGVSADALPWEAAANRMPFGKPAGGEPQAALEKNGGAIRARVAIESLHRTVEQSVVNAEVYAIDQDGSEVTVFASNGIYKADEVFVAAGAGTSGLAKAGGVDIPEDRACHLRLTFESRLSQPLPCLLDRSKQFGEVAYGSPTPDGRGYAIGISSDDGAVRTPDAETPDPVQLRRIRSRTESYARRLLPTALGSVTDVRLCLATPLASGDDDFYAWRRDRITYVAGHNLFKFAPLIGTLLAESTDGQGLPPDLQLADSRP